MDWISAWYQLGQLFKCGSLSCSSRHISCSAKVKLPELFRSNTMVIKSSGPKLAFFEGKSTLLWSPDFNPLFYSRAGDRGLVFMDFLFTS